MLTEKKPLVEVANINTTITSNDTAERILNKINRELEHTDETVDVDFKGVLAMTTSCAKLIFGTLYVSNDPKVYFKRIRIINTTSDFRLIINYGIQSALSDQEDV